MNKELTTEEYYNKLWLENKDLIQENIERLDKKRFALQLMLAEKDKEIERLNNIINELEKWLYDRSEFTNFGVVIDKIKELKGSDKE